ncbi:glycosyltransferase family 2 protein [Novosphingobium sp. G106]|uniref:glycosyltransferase family 2 protein n=1 Tax=Novosphingobium sp. G106 TaxID=2849500 RepID=UPI001C2CE55C|nr:glycosyltransferase family 2 protein [Novosphingobium sp. G106]MBV1689338.1 glycosyltransferase family 2 protein [Novosphingobium sp. G106]
MNEISPLTSISHLDESDAPDISIIMPCLNEHISLPHCIANARQALELINLEFGLSGEIVIADNGSIDGSQVLAESLGARVVDIERRGYGAALIGGCHAARGRFLLMGDSDGSYDFTDGVAMIGRLAGGADLVMGNRFSGGIARGAMPWKNRYIGNPALSGVLNLFFRTGIADAHCGLRAIAKSAFLDCALTSSGMEFASEMVIKARLLHLRIEEVPAKLLPDLRERDPHLRPWRDGWRHLRYLLMLSPMWAFGVPALLAGILGGLLLLASCLEYLWPGLVPQVGAYWTLLGSACIDIGHLAFLLGLTGHLYGVRAGFRRPTVVTRIAARVATLETFLLSGLIMIVAGIGILGLVAFGWVNRDFKAAFSILPPVGGILVLTLGVQNVLGGFLMAIVGGNEARFFAPAVASGQTR